MANLDQHLVRLSTDRVLVDLLCEDLGYDRTESSRRLAQIDMPFNEQIQLIHELSRGKQARLGLLVLHAENANSFVRHEPTTHLSIAGQEALEVILTFGERTYTFVTHDRRMPRSVPTRDPENHRGRLLEADYPEDFPQKIWEPAGEEADQVRRRAAGF